MQSGAFLANVCLFRTVPHTVTLGESLLTLLTTFFSHYHIKTNLLEAVTVYTN